MDALTPTSNNDELAILGGQTRLVKKEPGSPQMFDRSPTSHNPVVPLPLSTMSPAHVDPNLLEYLNSFQQQQQPVSASSSNSYSDVADMSPVSMYGLTSLPGPTNGFHSADASNYQSMASTPVMPSADSSFQHHHSQNQHHNQSSLMSGSSGAPSFPQYFPVYDYGASTSNNPYAPMLDSSPVPLRRSSSGSPDQNLMHTVWQEFVTSNGFAAGN